MADGHYAFASFSVTELGNMVEPFVGVNPWIPEGLQTWLGLYAVVVLEQVIYSV